MIHRICFGKPLYNVDFSYFTEIKSFPNEKLGIKGQEEQIIYFGKVLERIKGIANKKSNLTSRGLIVPRFEECYQSIDALLNIDSQIEEIDKLVNHENPILKIKYDNRLELPCSIKDGMLYIPEEEREKLKLLT